MAGLDGRASLDAVARSAAGTANGERQASR
jgi:hypothetical protein